MRNSVILQHPDSHVWWQFSQPVEIIQVYSVQDVLASLHHLETQVNAGLYAAGFLSYEAASAFDPALATYQLSNSFPLLWFGLYEKPKILSHADLLRLRSRQGYRLDQWTATISQAEFEQAIAQIKTYIFQGDTYQVNYSFRLQTAFAGDPWSLFLDLVQAQPQSYSALIDIDNHVICSVSPELFFQQVGSKVTTQPMKGTAERGLSYPQDEKQIEWLRSSLKNQAENLMIVDMLRNDLGQIAQVGSVNVPSLFDVERYPTLLQMTSTVTAKTTSRTTDIIKCLFPCASITGAPKVRTTEIIRDLETSPRKIYTGSIGYIAPNQRAQFNVAIRTVLIDRQTGQAEYGVGSGITWDSDTPQEYAECLTKTEVLTTKQPDFSLLETMLWTPEAGYFLLDYHLKRLQESATYFGFAIDKVRIRAALQQQAHFFATPTKVRLLLHPNGSWTLDVLPITLTTRETPLRIRLANQPIDPHDRFLYHKTTQRQVYEQAYQTHLDYDDVLLWNPKREITESCIANVIVQYRSAWLTPPIDCGLLAGTYRAWLLDQGKIKEEIISFKILEECEQILLANSVQGCQQAVLTKTTI